ncbi:MAG: hypothetical protein BA870_05595 [Desulfuromonadales bacterium C00003094]|jgi:hypothetical protein|nr:MAG: hypothetical protein BA870_05595 [Desulfuromonadales bacterium C00003094]
MKKVILLTTCMLFVSSMAFAATTIDLTLTSKTTTGGEVRAHDTTASASTALIGKNSTGVGTGMITSALGYSLVTQHLNGSKAYGSSYDSTSMFVEDVTTIGTVFLAKPSAIDTASFVDWNEL